MKEPVPASPSEKLQKANERLYELRQQAQSHKAELGLMGPTRPLIDVPPWEDAESSENELTTIAPVTKLPSHLGWGSALATQAIRNSIHRRERKGTNFERLTADHLPFQPVVDGSDRLDQPSDSHSKTHVGYHLRLPVEDDTVKHYPTIGIAALKREQAAIYRIWLLCRYLDEPGRGWLHVHDVREQLTGKESKLRLFGWRRLRQVLGQGHGRFWNWDKVNGRVWLFGAARVAAHLEVTKLLGKPVLLPVTAVTKSIGEFKAHMYATWHSGRKSDNPISRQVQESITNIPGRTQRHYCKIAKIKRQSNIAIGNNYNQKEFEKQAWQRGRAIFKFTDYRGRLGRKGNCYISWHLPNSYTDLHQQTTNGRMRKINRKLSDLGNKGARGNGGETVEKLYFANGKESVRSFNQEMKKEIYWFMTTKKSNHYFWSCFFAA